MKLLLRLLLKGLKGVEQHLEKQNRLLEIIALQLSGQEGLMSYSEEPFEEPSSYEETDFEVEAYEELRERVERLGPKALEKIV